MRKRVRTGAVVATGLLTALTLTGCGNDSDQGDTGKGSGSTATPAPGGGDGSGSATGGEDGGSTGGLKALEGAWAGKTDGRAVVLSVASGKAVVVADSHVCTGSAEGADKVTLVLRCADGDTGRTAGAIESNDGKTVVVSWADGTKDTLGKTDAASLEDLPGLPTS